MSDELEPGRTDPRFTIDAVTGAVLTCGMSGFTQENEG